MLIGQVLAHVHLAVLEMSNLQFSAITVKQQRMPLHKAITYKSRSQNGENRWRSPGVERYNAHL